MGFWDELGSKGKDFAVNTYKSLQEKQAEYQEGYDDAYERYLYYSDDDLKEEFLRIKRDIRTNKKKGRAMACKDILVDRGIIRPKN